MKKNYETLFNQDPAFVNKSFDQIDMIGTLDKNSGQVTLNQSASIALDTDLCLHIK